MFSVIRKIRAHNCRLQSYAFQQRADELRKYMNAGAIYDSQRPEYRRIIRIHERHARKWNRFANVLAGG